jgi:prepilin-type N-terminal cleavage/methylation domain-containing protein
MIKIIKNYNSGFSLVELLVAISVFLIFITTTINIIVSVNRQLQNASNKERAAALSEEALEAVRNIRDENFNNLIDGTYGLSSLNSQWEFSGTSDTNDIFNRQIVISTINAYQKKVVSTVTWQDQISQNNSVTQSTYLTDWQTPLNIGLTMNKIVINHGGVKTADDFLPNVLTTNILDNSVEPPVGISIDVPIVYAPETMVLGLGSYNFLTSSDPDYNLTLTPDCAGNSITLQTGDTKICTITYEENVAPTISNPTSTSITQTTATLGAEVTSLGIPDLITERGTCWGTSPSPVTNCLAEGGTTTGVFTQVRTGFIPGTTYYYRGYATNATGTAYSADGSFTTTSNNVIPTVTTPTAIAITSTTATLGANVTSLGFPASISARGICYGTIPSPMTNCVAEGGTTTGVFTQARTGFIPGTTYYYRGYATNATGTAYSADGSFTTNAICSTVLVGVPTIYDSAGSSSAVVSKPTGVVQNDIMFAHILHFNGTDRLTVIPAGWTSIGRHKNGSYNQALYYKVAGPSEGSSYTFGLSANSKFAVTISAYRGCFNISNPIDTYSNTEYVVNNTTYRASSISISSPYTNVLMFPSIYSTAVRTFANPLTQGGGWTEDYDHGNTAPDFSRAGYRKLINTSGVIGIIDSIGQTGSTIKHAFSVALKPL